MIIIKEYPGNCKIFSGGERKKESPKTFLFSLDFFDYSTMFSVRLSVPARFS